MFFKHKNKIIGSFLASLGFILSPLTWWNDIFVNLPLAFAFAYIVGLIISPIIDVTFIIFSTFVVIGYFLTDVLGFILMQRGASMLFRKKKIKISWRRNIIYSLLAIVLVFASVKLELLDLSNANKLAASILNVSYLK